MSSYSVQIPSPAWLVPSSVLLLGAAVRVTMTAGLLGAMALLKTLVTPVAIAVIFMLIQLTNGMSQDPAPPFSVGMSRRGMYFLIVVTDLILLAVIIFGPPFLTAMNFGR